MSARAETVQHDAQSDSATAGASVRCVTTLKPRKPRKPSKRVQAMIDAARDDGFHAGMNMPRDQWPGAIAALVIAALAFSVGAWFF